MRDEYFGVGNNPHSLAVGDFNGDQMLDIVTANMLSSDVTLLINTINRGCPFIGRQN